MLIPIKGTQTKILKNFLEKKVERDESLSLPFFSSSVDVFREERLHIEKFLEARKKGFISEEAFDIKYGQLNMEETFRILGLEEAIEYKSYFLAHLFMRHNLTDDNAMSGVRVRISLNQDKLHYITGFRDTPNYQNIFSQECVVDLILSLNSKGRFLTACDEEEPMYNISSVKRFISENLENVKEIDSIFKLEEKKDFISSKFLKDSVLGVGYSTVIFAEAEGRDRIKDKDSLDVGIKSFYGKERKFSYEHKPFNIPITKDYTYGFITRSGSKVADEEEIETKYWDNWKEYISYNNSLKSGHLIELGIFCRYDGKEMVYFPSELKSLSEKLKELE